MSKPDILACFGLIEKGLPVGFDDGQGLIRMQGGFIGYELPHGRQGIFNRALRFIVEKGLANGVVMVAGWILGIIVGNIGIRQSGKK